MNIHEERGTPSDVDFRGDLLKQLILSHVLQEITTDNASAIPPFDTNRLTSIDLSQQPEISREVAA